jgi:DNA polymerase-3 subunit beta
MEFKIQKAEFLRGLRVAQSIADRKSTMPMLANVLLRTTGKDKLLVAATDLNVSVSAELASANKNEGGLTVSAKALHEIVANMPGEEISLRRAENNWANITAGKVSYRLVGMPDRDFPRIPDHRELDYAELSATTFREMIDKTLFSVCNDETRFHLNGVLFESDGKNTKMVATDGHRLALIERELEGAPPLTAGIIIPKKGLVEIKRSLDNVENCRVAVKTPYVFLGANGLTLAVKLIDSQFPPYDQVVPKDHEKQVVVDRMLLLDALKRAQLMSSETRGVKFSFSDGQMVLACDNPDIGEVREELDADYSGEEMSIGFNGKYVVDFLTSMTSDQVAFELKGELDPGLIRPVSGEDYVGVVMPMRI